MQIPPYYFVAKMTVLLLSLAGQLSSLDKATKNCSGISVIAFSIFLK